MAALFSQSGVVMTVKRAGCLLLVRLPFPHLETFHATMRREKGNECVTRMSGCALLQLTSLVQNVKLYNLYETKTPERCSSQAIHFDDVVLVEKLLQQHANKPLSTSPSIGDASLFQS